MRRKTLSVLMLTVLLLLGHLLWLLYSRYREQSYAELPRDNQAEHRSMSDAVWFPHGRVRR